MQLLVSYCNNRSALHNKRFRLMIKLQNKQFLEDLDKRSILYVNYFVKQLKLYPPLKITLRLIF